MSIAASASDADGDSLTYSWTVPAGLTATGQSSDTLVVTAPAVTEDTVYTLSVLVSDGALDASAQTVLTVKAPTTGGCDSSDPDAGNHPAWDSGTVYNSGETVSHNCLVWKAKYWTQGNEPRVTADQWALQSNVEMGWNAGVAYNGGEQTTHNGHTWQAKWWTKGEEPGVADVWNDLGATAN